MAKQVEINRVVETLGREQVLSRDELKHLKNQDWDGVDYERRVQYHSEREKLLSKAIDWLNGLNQQTISIKKVTEKLRELDNGHDGQPRRQGVLTEL